MRSIRADACYWPSTPVLTWRVLRCPCWFVARGRDSVLSEFVLYRALVLPGVSGCCMSAAYNGAVVAEVLIPAFGQRLAEQTRIDVSIEFWYI